MSRHPLPDKSIPTFSTEEAAAALKISPETVCEYIARGWLTATRIGRRWLVHQRSVLRLLETGTPPIDDAHPTSGRSTTP